MKTKKKAKDVIDPIVERSGDVAVEAETLADHVESEKLESSSSDTETNEQESLDPEQEKHQELIRLQTELASTRDQLLRQAADFQNYRRRVTQERATLVAQGRAQVAERLIDVWDDIKRSTEAAEQADVQASPEIAFITLKDGLKLVYDKFSNEMEKLDITPMQVEGQPFNEAEHDALMQQPAPDGIEPGTVLADVQRGYLMGERVLRHAKVIVAM
jgi:molecular chaperone GrpE